MLSPEVFKKLEELEQVWEDAKEYPVVFQIKSCCNHGYKQLKRVNDISIEGKFFRQVNCKTCGRYRYEFNPKDYHTILINEVIIIK